MRTEVVLAPMVAPAGTVRVWTGIYNLPAAPPMTWELDGRPVQPTVDRPLQPARAADWLQPDEHPADITPALTGIFSFAGLSPGTHRLRLMAGSVEAGLVVDTLPATLDELPDGELRILMASCYDSTEDRAGLVAQVVAAAKLRPHLTLLMGDQVYLDIPPFQYPRANVPDCARAFEAKYRDSWSMGRADHVPGWAQLLRLAPSIAVPDDHEYWNNAPSSSLWISNTWSEGGRQAWSTPARRLYTAFQQPARAFDGSPFRQGDPFIIDVPPISVLCADTRSGREGRLTLSPAALTRVRAWLGSLAVDGRVGVLVTGQPLLDRPSGSLKGWLADYTWPDFDDWAEILDAVAHSAAPVVLLTGDVHYGRISELRRQADGRVLAWEVISSPTSLVRTPGAVAGKGPWPWHAEAADPPSKLPGGLGGLKREGQEGDHVALLRLRRSGTGVDLRVTWQPIHADPARRVARESPAYRIRAH